MELGKDGRIDCGDLCEELVGPRQGGRTREEDHSFSILTNKVEYALKQKAVSFGFLNYSKLYYRFYRINIYTPLSNIRK